MFDSLADQIKVDQAQQVKKGGLILYWSVVALVSILVFGGLFVVVRFVE